MTFVKKSSPTVETVVGVAAANLKKSLVELKTGLETLETLNGKVEEIQLKIVSGEEKIKELGVQYEEKRRAHAVEFELKVKEDALAVVKATLGSHQLVTIPEQELKDLQAKLLEGQQSFDERVKKEVTATTGAIHGSYQHKEKLLEADFKAKEAENVASIKSLTSENASLKEQIKHWQEQLDAERKASVERAKAGSIGAINLGPSDAGGRR